MSGQHTKGRLTVVNDGRETLLRIVGEHGRRIASTFVQNHCRTSEGCKNQALENEANAARVAACWNACEGLSTESLESGHALITAFQREQDRADKAERFLERIRFALNDSESKLTESQLVRRAHELRQKAAKWEDWSDAQTAIENEMPEGFAFVLQCSPGDWDLYLTDPDGERVEFDRDNDTTAQMIISAIEAAKTLASTKAAA